jgi:hypothetical protein
MNGYELFAFVILPISIGVIAWAIVLINERRQKRRRDMEGPPRELTIAEALQELAKVDQRAAKDALVRLEVLERLSRMDTLGKKPFPPEAS